MPMEYQKFVRAKEVSPTYLKMARVGLSLTIRQLAMRASLDKSTISRSESGGPICLHTVEQIREALEDEGAYFWVCERAGRIFVEMPFSDLKVNRCGANGSTKNKRNWGVGQATPETKYSTLAECNEAITNGAINLDAYLIQSGIYAEQSDPLKAILDLDTVIQIDPNNIDAYCRRGIQYSILRDERALADFEKAISLDPACVDAYFYRSAFFGQCEEYDLAVRDLTVAIKLDARNSEYYRFRGLAYAGKSEHDRAISDFNIAIDLSRDNSEAYQHRGLSFGELGEYEYALEDLNKAVETDPTNSNTLKIRAAVFIKIGNHRSAKVDIEMMTRLDSAEQKA